jgi:protein SCO1/2
MRWVALVLLLALACDARASAATRSRDVRDVPLVDQLGTTFTLRALHRPAAVAFVATHCTDACPIVSAVLARLAAALARERLDARVVTIALEPREDPPVAMAAAARAYGADPTRWRWASGRVADVDRVLEAFGVYRVDDEEHSTLLYVLDARARLVRTLPLSNDADRELLALLRAHGAASRSRRSIASARSVGSDASWAQRSNARRASFRRPPRSSTVPSAKRARA